MSLGELRTLLPPPLPNPVKGPFWGLSRPTGLTLLVTHLWGHWVQGLLGLASRIRGPWRPSPSPAGFTPSDLPSMGATDTFYAPYLRPKELGEGRGGREPTPGSLHRTLPSLIGVPLPWKTKPGPLDFGLPHFGTTFEAMIWIYDVSVKDHFRLCPLSRPLNLMWSRVNHPNSHRAGIVAWGFIPMLAVI